VRERERERKQTSNEKRQRLSVISREFSVAVRYLSPVADVSRYTRLWGREEREREREREREKERNDPACNGNFWFSRFVDKISLFCTKDVGVPFPLRFQFPLSLSLSFLFFFFSLALLSVFFIVTMADKADESGATAPGEGTQDLTAVVQTLLTQMVRSGERERKREERKREREREEREGREGEDLIGKTIRLQQKLMRRWGEEYKKRLTTVPLCLLSSVFMVKEKRGKQRETVTNRSTL
jgi:hypothetical protein